MRRHARGLVVAAIGASLMMALMACSDDGSSVGSGGSPSTTASVAGKVPDSVSKLAAQVSDARRGGATDVSGSSTEFVHVRADGKIELVLRAPGPISGDQQADLVRLGVDVTGSIGPDGLQVWIPADKVGDVAALGWVTSLSPPSYSHVGG